MMNSNAFKYFMLTTMFLCESAMAMKPYSFADDPGIVEINERFWKEERARRAEEDQREAKRCQELAKQQAEIIKLRDQFKATFSQWDVEYIYGQKVGFSSSLTDLYFVENYDIYDLNRRCFLDSWIHQYQKYLTPKAVKHIKRGRIFDHPKTGYTLCYQVRGDETPTKLTDEQIENLRSYAATFSIRDGLLLREGVPFSTDPDDKCSNEPSHLITINKEGEFYILPRYFGDKEAKVYHSILLSDSDSVRFAGTLQVEEGKITYLTNESGHYRPWEGQLAQTVMRFEKEGILAEGLTILSYSSIEHLYEKPDDEGNLTFGKMLVNAFRAPTLEEKKNRYAQVFKEFKTERWWLTQHERLKLASQNWSPSKKLQHLNLTPESEIRNFLSTPVFAETLESINLERSNVEQIHLINLPMLKEIAAEFARNLKTVHLENLEGFEKFYGLPSKIEILSLKNLNSMKNLELQYLWNLKQLTFEGKFPKFLDLLVQHCGNLEDIEGIENLSELRILCIAGETKLKYLTVGEENKDLALCIDEKSEITRSNIRGIEHLKEENFLF